MESIYAHSVPEAYVEGLFKLRIYDHEETSRNGPVLTIPQSVHLTISNPRQRVLFDGVRDANPFFHLMETAWMFAGRDDLSFILPFNKGFEKFADPCAAHLHGAYGRRWRVHFGVDQILGVINLLRKDPMTRRAVIGMWDPTVDLEPHNDLPCNTSVIFRNIEGHLDMTVINRSNDFIWGMLGANAVHMTFLHELIAHGADLKLGQYHVFTNNLHIYKNMPRFDEIWNSPTVVDVGTYRNIEPRPMFTEDDSTEDVLADCVDLCNGALGGNTFFGQHLLFPAKMAYEERLKGGTGEEWIEKIKFEDWKLACQNFVDRRKVRK